MTQTALTDDAGKWFEKSEATEFSENTWWNGSNYISSATGSQWDHQELFYTRCGLWVLHCWSQYQNIQESYHEIDQPHAVDWLISQEHFGDLGGLPDDVRMAVQTSIKKAEV